MNDWSSTISISYYTVSFGLFFIMNFSRCSSISSKNFISLNFCYNEFYNYYIFPMLSSFWMARITMTVCKFYILNYASDPFPFSIFPFVSRDISEALRLGLSLLPIASAA